MRISDLKARRQEARGQKSEVGGPIRARSGHRAAKTSNRRWSSQLAADRFNYAKGTMLDPCRLVNTFENCISVNRDKIAEKLEFFIGNFNESQTHS